MGIFRGSFGEISNKADWISRVYTMTNESDDVDADLSDGLLGVLIEIVVRQKDSATDALSGTLADGTIELSGGGFFWHFTPDDLGALQPDTYDVGVKVTISGIEYDVILATVVVLEGV